MSHFYLVRKSNGSRRCLVGWPNNCFNLRLLQAQQSEVHTRPLIAATDEINAILDRLREEAPERQHLALFATRVGPILVWAEPIEPPIDRSAFVTDEDDDDEVRAALGIVEETAAA